MIDRDIIQVVLIMPHRTHQVFDDLKKGVANGSRERKVGPFEVHIGFKPYLMQKYSKVITRYIKVCFAAILKRIFQTFPTSQVGMVQELERRGARVACTYTGGLDFSVPVQEPGVVIWDQIWTCKGFRVKSI